MISARSSATRADTSSDEPVEGRSAASGSDGGSLAGVTAVTLRTWCDGFARRSGDHRRAAYTNVERSGRPAARSVQRSAPGSAPVGLGFGLGAGRVGCGISAAGISGADAEADAHDLVVEALGDLARQVQGVSGLGLAV